MTVDSSIPLVIGTRNRKKGEELAEMLAPYGFSVLTLADVAGAIDVVEDGDSFAANAALKATQQATHLRRWVLADDSGLEVDALGGAPGIFSARFASTVAGLEAGRPGSQTPATAVAGLYEAGAPGSQTPATAPDEQNNHYLLQQLGNTPLEKRTARYVCHVTVADPSGAIRADSEDVCHGRIRFEPAGTNGFGYDPLFEVVEYHRTFGEFGPHVKRAISHRSRALRAIVPKLVDMLGAGSNV